MQSVVHRGPYDPAVLVDELATPHAGSKCAAHGKGRLAHVATAVPSRGQDLLDLAGDVALQATDDFGF